MVNEREEFWVALCLCLPRKFRGRDGASRTNSAVSLQSPPKPSSSSLSTSQGQSSSGFAALQLSLVHSWPLCEEEGGGRARRGPLASPACPWGVLLMCKPDEAANCPRWEEHPQIGFSGFCDLWPFSPHPLGIQCT